MRFCISIRYNRSQMRFHFARHALSLSLSVSLFCMQSFSVFRLCKSSTNSSQCPAGVDFNEHHTKPMRAPACVHPIGESTRAARVTQRQPTHQRFVTCNYYELKAVLRAG